MKLNNIIYVFWLFLFSIGACNIGEKKSSVHNPWSTKINLSHKDYDKPWVIRYTMFCSLLSDIAFSKFNFDYSIFIWIFEKYFIYCRISCPFFSLSNFNLHKLSQLGLCQGYPLLLRIVKLHFDSDNVPNAYIIF